MGVISSCSDWSHFIFYDDGVFNIESFSTAVERTKRGTALHYGQADKNTTAVRFSRPYTLPLSGKRRRAQAISSFVFSSEGVAVVDKNWG